MRKFGIIFILLLLVALFVGLILSIIGQVKGINKLSTGGLILYGAWFVGMAGVIAGMGVSKDE